MGEVEESIRVREGDVTTEAEIRIMRCEKDLIGHYSFEEGRG